MKASQVLGVVLILVGVGLVLCWVDSNWWHPTREVLQNRANRADYGGIAALSPDPTKIYLMGGFAAFVAAGHFLKK